MSKFTDEPIAIIGTSCRFPGGASSPSKLWELLVEPKDVVKKIPGSRFGYEPFYNPDPSYHGVSNLNDWLLHTTVVHLCL